MFLNDRDCDILHTLAFKVRLLTAAQLQATWWPEVRTERSVFALTRLRNAGHLHRFVVLAHPLLTLRAPLFSWKQGEPPPNAKRLALYLRRRWTGHPRTVVVHIASRFTAHWLGGAGGLVRRRDATHDLHLAAVYLHFKASDASAARAWKGEDVLGKGGFRVKDPDAVIQYDDGRAPLVVEFAGRYDEDRILEFHTHCKTRGLAYQLW